MSEHKATRDSITVEVLDASEAPAVFAWFRLEEKILFRAT
jgi:hypothetical protein